MDDPVDLHALPSPSDLFTLMNVIGNGTYGDVYMGKHKKTGEFAAIKVLELVEDEEDEIRVEIEVLKACGEHQNISSFYGAYLTDGMNKESRPTEMLWIVMELCDGGSVTDLARSMEPKHLSEQIIAYVLREALEGLAYLHKCDVIHRDVKGQNILLLTSGEVRLVDFGVSAKLKKSNEERNTFIGTPYWMAPEIIACDSQPESVYDKRSDSWAVGITAIEIAEMEPPLSDMHPMRALFLIPRNPSPGLKKPQPWSELFQDFIAQCLIKDYYKRPIASKLLGHKFIKAVKKQDGQKQLATLLTTKAKHNTLKRPEDDEGVVLPDPGSLENAVAGSVLEQELAKTLQKRESHRTKTRKRAKSSKRKKPRVGGLAGGSEAVPGVLGSDEEDNESTDGRPNIELTIKRSEVKSASDGATFLDRVMSKDERAKLPDATMVVKKNKKGEITKEPMKDANNIPGFAGLRNDGFSGTLKMPDIRKFKKRFNSEIFTAFFWGANLLVGLRGGLIFLDRTGDGRVFPLISRRRFKQIEVMESLGVMVAICGKKDKLRMYNLDYFKGQILRNLEPQTELFSTVGDLEECPHFKIARFERMKFLCVASKMKIIVFLWAPKPYHKFMLFKEFDVQHQPLIVDLKVDEDESLKLVFASKTGFHSIDVESGNVLNLFVPLPRPPKGIHPLSITQLRESVDGEYLLCYDNFGVIVDSYGEVIRQVPLEWADLPTSIAWAYPDQVLGWGSKAIEIRSTINGELQGIFKHHRATKLRFLCARNNKVFFASISGTVSQVYFMVF